MTENKLFDPTALESFMDSQGFSSYQRKYLFQFIHGSCARNRIEAMREFAEKIRPQFNFATKTEDMAYMMKFTSEIGAKIDSALAEMEKEAGKCRE